MAQQMQHQAAAYQSKVIEACLQVDVNQRADSGWVRTECRLPLSADPPGFGLVAGSVVEENGQVFASGSVSGEAMQSRAPCQPISCASGAVARLEAEEVSGWVATSGASPPGSVRSAQHPEGGGMTLLIRHPAQPPPDREEHITGHNPEQLETPTNTHNTPAEAETLPEPES